MLGLEKIYYDLDGVRKRLRRLVDMERVPEKKAIPLMTKVLVLMEDVNEAIEKGIEHSFGGDNGDREPT